MRIVSRAEWGARPPRSRELVAPTARRQLVVHYSTGQELGRSDSAAWVREVQRFHQGPQRGWADVGYNFLVDARGVVFEGRGWDVIGAHAPGYNTSGVGVCFLGNDDPDVWDVTDAARWAFRELWQLGSARAGRQLALLGHRDTGRATACPGDELHAWLRAGMPLAADTASQPPSAQPTRPTAPAGSSAPRFPLPSGYAYGPWTGPREVVSGFTVRGGRISGRLPLTDPRRAGLLRWQRRMVGRGWRLTPDGLYGEQTAEVAGAFQREKGLKPDRLVGPVTWAAAWTAPVT